MKETKEQIREILDIIESQEDLSTGDKLTMDQIKDILLGRKATDMMLRCNTSALKDTLGFLSASAQLDFYLPLPEERSLRMKIANFIKRIVRKLIRPIMLPIVDAQSRFNNAALLALEHMARQEEVLITEQTALRQLTVSLGRELKESSDIHE